MHDDTFVRVRQFQFVQEVPGQAVLCVIPVPGYGTEDELRIQCNLSRKFDGRLAFTIKHVDAIRLSAGGKAIYVDQRIKDRKGKSTVSEGAEDSSGRCAEQQDGVQFAEKQRRGL